MVAHILNPRTWDAEAGKFCDFKVSLVYKVNIKKNSNAVSNFVLKKEKEKQNKKQKKI